MSHTSEGLIQINGNNDGINVLSDIGYVLGTGSGDVGTNCTSNNINKYAKYKPNNLTGWGPPSEANMRNNRYALYGNAVVTNTHPDGTFPTLANAGWTYTGPNTNVGQKYYRVLDFKNYFHNAPCPFMQANGTSINLDLLNPTASMLFYLLMANGRYANSAFSTESGTNKRATAVTATNLQYCICIDPSVSEAVDGVYDQGLSFSTNGGSSYISNGLLGAYCGVVVYTKLGNTYSYRTELFTNEARNSSGDYPISTSYSQDTNEMFMVPLAKLCDTLSVGTYYLVPCAKKTIDSSNYYMPVENYNSLYPAVVELKAGLDNYKQEIISYETGTHNHELKITMRIHNLSSNAATIVNDNTNRQKLSLSVTINTQENTYIVPGDGSTPYQLSNQIRTALPILSQDLTIPANGYVDVVYQIDHIWYTSTSATEKIIDSGTIVVEPTIKYNNQTSFPWCSGANRSFVWNA